MADPPSSGQSESARWTMSQLPAPRLLTAVAVIVVVYGIAQPAILRLLDVNGGEDLKVADFISALVAMLSLLAATIGLLVYATVKRSLEDALGATIAESDRRREGQLADAMLQVTAFAASEAWQRLEPYLVADQALDPTDAALRDSIIEYGLDCSEGAASWLQRCDETHRTGPYWPASVKLNQALFLACRALAARSSIGNDAVAARRLLPSIDQVSTDEALETIAWVRLCCYPRGSDEWQEGRSLALRIIGRTGSEVMRRRYQAAFPGIFPRPPAGG